MYQEDNFIGSQPIVHGAEIVIDVIQPGPDSDSLSSSKTEDRRSKRILHFSDGTLEESSSDEEVMHELPVDSPLVNPVSTLKLHSCHSVKQSKDAQYMTNLFENIE